MIFIEWNWRFDLCMCWWLWWCVEFIINLFVLNFFLLGFLMMGDYCWSLWSWFWWFMRSKVMVIGCMPLSKCSLNFIFWRRWILSKFFVFKLKLIQQRINFSKRSNLDFNPTDMCFTFNMTKIIIVVHIANLTIGMVSIWHGFWDIFILNRLYIKVSFKLFLQVNIIGFASLLLNFSKVLCGMFQLCFTETRTVTMRCIHF